MALVAHTITFNGETLRREKILWFSQFLLSNSLPLRLSVRIAVVLVDAVRCVPTLFGLDDCVFQLIPILTILPTEDQLIIIKGNKLAIEGNNLGKSHLFGVLVMA